MILKKIIAPAFVIACFIYTPLFSQDKRIPAAFKGGTDCGIQCKIAHYFADSKTNNGCGSAFFFTKFTISAKGEIVNIEFSNGTKKMMESILIDALHSTNGLWDPETVNGKPVESKPFLLPVYYFFDNHCRESIDTMLVIGKEVYMAKPVTIEGDPEYKVGPEYSLEHMLNFSKEEPPHPRNSRNMIFPQFEGYVISMVYLKKDLFRHY